MLPEIYLSWDSKITVDAIDLAMAEKVIPALRNALTEAAAEVAQKGEKTPLARMVAAEKLIRATAEVLALSSFDDTEFIQLSMLSDNDFINWWFSVEDEADESTQPFTPWAAIWLTALLAWFPMPLLSEVDAS